MVVDGALIETTEEHPFFVEGEGFVGAVSLQNGDVLRLASGENAKVEKLWVEALDEKVPVYNFEVADYHTYYVSEMGVLVHNMCAVGNNPITVGNDKQSVVYRVLRKDENPLNGLKAKNPTRGMTVEGHVTSGSRNNGSQFISTTTDIKVAKEYAKKDSCIIVEIDLKKLPDSVNVYDLSTTSGRNKYLKGVMARNFASKSREVLLEGYIPSYAIKFK